MINARNCSFKRALLFYVHLYNRVVTNERKFSWRWNIVGKLFQGMKKNLWKKWTQDNFSLSCTSVVKMHWKPDRNYAKYVCVGRFRTFVFFAIIKTLWNFWILFLKTVHQKGLLEQIKKKVEFLLLSPDSWKLLTTSLNDLHQYILGFKSNISARVLTKSWFQILNFMRSRRASLEFMMVGSNSYIPASIFTNSQFLILIEVAYRKMEKTFEF